MGDKITLSEKDRCFLSLSKDKWSVELIVEFCKAHFSQLEISINDMDESNYIVKLAPTSHQE